MTEFEYKTVVIDSKETEHSEKSLSDKLNHYGKPFSKTFLLDDR